MFLFKKWRRKRLAERKFPVGWLRIIEKNVPLYRRLSSEDQAELRRHILIFMGEKRFEGCRGLEITDEIKVTIAAQACILLLHRKTDYYPGLSTILVYPRAFVVRWPEHLGGGVMSEEPRELLGESWHRGPVVLSWDDVKHDTADINDGHNVVFHEFAHQIESSGGRGDDTIVLKSSSSYIAWARVLQKDYEKLREAAARRQPTLLNQYGATKPEEFFAVVTEFFFEKPRELKEIHPELYNELKQFYHQDPTGYLT
jgi:MtfA peptidase